MTLLNLESPKPLPFGQRVGRLTRFGETWLDLDKIDAINFEPADGCGCEVDLSTGNCQHLSKDDADCLRLYMNGLATAAEQVDEAAREGLVHA